MPVHRLLAGLSLDPDAMKAVTKAYDKAWSVVSLRFARATVEEVELAKSALAHAILTASRNGAVTDVEVLLNAGLSAARASEH